MMGIGRAESSGGWSDMGPGVMSAKKRVADLLTASRGLIALLIVLLSLEGKRALPMVILLTIVGWTTDILDGQLARRAAAEGALDLEGDENTWIGEHDFALDMIMVYAGFFYLAAAGYVPTQWALGYTLLAAFFVLLTRGSKSVTMLLAFPLVALPLLIAVREAPWAAYVYGIWIVLALILFWHRFVGVVKEFLEGMAHLRA